MTAANQTTARLWTPNFIRIFLANFTTCAIGNMFNSPYALHLVSLGGKEMHVGVAAFIYAVCSVIMRPVAAWFLDNRSRKKIYFFCLLATGGLMCGYLFAPLIMMIVVRGFQGLFFSAVSTASTTNGYDTINPEKFSEGVGYMGFSNAMATTLMPSVGLWIYNSFGFRAFFLAEASLALIAFFLMLGFKFEEIEWKPAPKLSEINILDLVAERRALPPSILTAFAAIVNAATANFMALYLISIHSQFGAGLYFMLQGLGTLISRTFIGKIMDRKGESPIITTSCITMVTALIGLIYAEIPAMFFIGGLSFGVCVGMTATCMQVMSVRSVPKEHRARAASTYLLCWELFYALGGLVSGTLITWFSYKTSFLILMVMAPAYFLTYRLWVSKTDSAFKVIKAKEAAHLEELREAARKRAKGIEKEQ